MDAKYIVGIDEVGRGPLAGPLTLCFVCISSDKYKILKKNKNLPKLGKDSKKLNSKLREKYSKYLKELPIKYSIVSISNKEIDKKGIFFCIKKAIKKGLDNLNLDPKNTQILLDGGLKAPDEFIFQKTIIKGDEKEKIIAWASILAKVERDKFMIKISKKFPHYFFEINKGYGTKIHREAILKHGMSELHRKSFCRIYL